VNVLVVWVHPCEESLGGAVYLRVLDGLHRSGHDVHAIDLYRCGFAPGGPLPGAQVEELAWAQSLVFVYPTWWSGQPALLGAWLIAVSRCQLSHVRRLVCVTTLGGPRVMNKLAGESGRKAIGQSLRRRCAPDARFRWCALYGLDRERPHERTAFLDRVERSIGRLVR
jgi:putative NADPH-quinone reductase